MTVSRVFQLCFVLISAHSTLGNFPYPYPQFQPSIPLTTHLIYNVPIDGKAVDFAGFSYFTKDLGGNGGHSEVVFVTGPNSDAQMKDEVAAMKDQLGSPTPAPDSTENATGLPVAEKQKLEDSKEVEAAEKKPDDPTPATAAPVEDKVTSTSAPKNGGDQGVTNGQLIPEEAFALRAPYPILRLRGSTSYYPQSIGGFPGYEPFDYFKSKYDPFYEPNGPYQTLYHPFYSALDDYYSRLAPLSYSSPVLDSQFFAPAVNNFIPGGSLPAFTGLEGGQEIAQKIGADEVGKISAEKPDTKAAKDSATAESPVTDGAGSDSETKPELSTPTEQSSESGSTPVSDNVSSTEETSKTEASSTENATVAVEIA